MKILLIILAGLLTSCVSNSSLPEEKTNSKQIAVQITPSKPIFTLDELIGNIKPNQHSQFQKLPYLYSNKTIYINKTVYQDLDKMISAARKDGIVLTVISGFRSYDYQTQIWNQKWKKLGSLQEEQKAIKILEFSAFPGISRHHWGTDIDFNSVENHYWISSHGKRILSWLQKNAQKYGFCNIYSGKSQGVRQGGYEDEPWHWSHIETAKNYYLQQLDSIEHILKLPILGQDILLQKGKDFLSNYVAAIAEHCHSH